MQKNIFNTIGAKHEIVIQGSYDKDVQIAVEGPEWLDLKIEQLEKHEKSICNRWLLEFSLNQSLSLVTEGDIVIKTNIPRFEVLYVRITVEPKPLLRISPPVLFANVMPNIAWKKEVEITFLEDQHSKADKQNEIETLSDKSSVTNSKKQNIHIEPSSDSIQLKRLFFGQNNKQKYLIVIQSSIPSPQYLNIMLDGMLIHKIPIIVSKMSPSK